MKRPPRKKPNTIQVNWSKLPHSSPDYVVAWGEGCFSYDARLAMAAISSLGDELKERGYDITTIRFSIQRPALSAIGRKGGE
jgi:hypothetical protein